MKKKLALFLSAALVATLGIPVVAFGVGGVQQDEAEQQATAVQESQDSSGIIEESASVENLESENQSASVEAEVPATTPARGYNYVDDDGDGVCDNFGSGNCAGTGNGFCDGTGAGNGYGAGNGNGVCDGTGAGNGYGAGNGVCDGSGVDGARGFGNRGGNGQGAADRSCDGTGREAAQGAHRGNGYQRG